MDKEKRTVLDKINDGLNGVLSTVQVVAIVVAAIMVTLDVLLRALFSKPISGTSEYVGYIMILASFFGLGICTAERSHLKVDLIVQLFSEKAQLVNDIINSVLVAAVGGIMLWASINQGKITFGLKTKGAFSGVLNWPFYLLMGLGYLPVVLGSVNNLIQDVRALTAAKKEKGGAET